MWTHHDQALIQRDTALPGLAVVLRPSAFRTTLERLLPDAPLDAVTPDYVRYKPGMNCLVAYRVEAGGTTYPVYAKAHRPDDLVKLEKATSRPATDTPLGPGRHVLPAWSVVVSLFPNDGKLRVLHRLGETDRKRALLARVLPARPDLWDAGVHLLRYKPERRFVARLSAGDRTAALKMYTTAGYPMARSGSRAFEERGALRLAPLLGRSDRHHVLAFGWVHGLLLRDLLRHDATAMPALHHVGAALAALHGQQGTGLPVRSRAMEAARLLAVAEGVAALLPRRSRYARTLATRLARRLEDLPTTATPIHGDFYDKQVLLRDDTAVVLDLDESALGHPAIDLGNFIAHLERDRMRHGGPAHRVEAMAAALLDGYATTARVPRHLDLHTAAALLLLAHHPFRFREPDWADRIEALLERTDTLARRADTSPSFPAPGRAAEPPEAAEDPALPFLARALSPEPAQEHLRHFIPHLAGHTLRHIRMQRHKPGRRCLIAYTLDPPASGEPLLLLGKARARGLDRTTYRLMNALWQGPFGPASTDGVCVPEPVGCIPPWHMWLQRVVPGLPSTVLLDGPRGPGLAERIAAALHALHRHGPAPTRRHTIDDELAILHDRLPRVAHRHPALAPRLARLLTACDRLGATLATDTLTPIHRDFYPDHVLVDGLRLYLIDFDLYALGDPALDAGNFLGHVIEWSLRQHGDAQALATWLDTFTDAFVAPHGAAMRRRVEAYTTLTLARHVYLSTLFEARRPFTAPLLALCEARLAVPSCALPRTFSV